MTRRSTARIESRRRLAFVGIAAFLLLDAALVIWALNANRADAPAVVSAPVATDSPAASPSGTPSSEPTDVPSALPVAVPARLLAAVDGEVAWRATTGECGVAAAPELTDTGGAEWLSTDATGPTGASALQRLVPESAGVATMVALDDDCAPTVVRTYVAGDNYELYPSDLVGLWHIDPADRAAVQAPSGRVSAPCASVVGLAVRSEAEAAVLCADGLGFVTIDGGIGWSAPLAVAGAQSIGTGPDGYIVGAIARPECAGVLMVPIEPAGAILDARGCLAVEATPEALVGQIAIDDGDGALWAWVGDRVARSFDGGATWA